VQKEVFYSPALDALVQARQFLCEYSFSRAHERILKTKNIRERDELQLAENAEVGRLYELSRHIILNASQYGDDRPLCNIRYAPHGDLVASGSLNAQVRLWDARAELQTAGTLRGFEERITALAWHPDAFCSSTNHGLLATASAGKVCKIWKCAYARGDDDTEGTEVRGDETIGMSVDENSTTLRGGGRPTAGGAAREVTAEVVCQMDGHQAALTGCEFHPSGRLLGRRGLSVLFDLSYILSVYLPV
jgi:U4/U6 small nuclear ribonucleoprotein PRP4